MTDDQKPSRRVLIVQWAIIVAVAVFVLYTVGTNLAEQQQDRIDACDEQHGDDQWVFVEKEQTWYEELMNIGGPGPVKCVAIDSPRAEDCVVGSTLADYNERCAEL